MDFITKNERQILRQLETALASLTEYDGTEDIQSKLSEVIESLSAMTGDEVETGSKGYKKPKKSVEKRIVEEAGQYCVTNDAGTRKFGCYPNRKDAKRRLEQVEGFATKLKQVETDDLRHTRIIVMASIQDEASEDLMAGYSLIEETLESRGFEAPFYIENDLTQLQELTTTFKQAMTDAYVPITKSESRYTLGPVYVPNLEDAHGETIDDVELQQAIWDWVRKGDRDIHLQHSDKVAGEMVEILTWPSPIETTLTVPNEGVTKYSFPANTPFMGVIWEPWAWDLVKSGELRGYSIGGNAERIEVQLPAEALVEMEKKSQ